jgi:tRNA(Ile)-lysidine synthase
MSALLDRVRQFVRRHDLADRTTRVAVALSGGSDSVALAHMMRRLDAAGEVRVVGLAHFNHQLRDSADRDERFCAELAGSLGWPLCVEREDVAARARRERRSLEDAAHTARHAFFERARARLEADVLALGHTRDDQAETFLLRLLRGAGPRGLASMHPRNGRLVRPLLSCRRDELRTYLARLRVRYVEDESNADVNIPRNRVRAELLPFLEERFNPSIVDVLADEADLARETWGWLELQAEELLLRARDGAARRRAAAHPGQAGRSTAGREGVSLELDVATLTAAPLVLRRLVVWRAMTRVAGGRPVGFDHVRAVLALLESGKGGSSDAPGHRVDRRGPDLVLMSRRACSKGRLLDDVPSFFDFPLSVPGEVPLPAAGCVLSAEASSAGELDTQATASDHGMAVVRRDLCIGSLRVRNRRPGDRFRPVGVGGQKKLQDFFVDRKVARQRRDSVPLVVDDTDRIVWVAGYGIDEAFRVTDPAQAVLILKLKLLGGPA